MYAYGMYTYGMYTYCMYTYGMYTYGRGWSPKFETGINIIIKSALYSVFWQDSITNIKIKHNWSVSNNQISKSISEGDQAF